LPRSVSPGTNKFFDFSEKSLTFAFLEMDATVEELMHRRTLPDEALRTLLESEDTSLADSLHRAAREVTDARFGKRIWLRALVEWSSVCRNDCLYCGIRRGNRKAERYTLSAAEILSACERAYRHGLRTFVLQGGENPSGAEALVPVVEQLRARWPDAAITLSLGELPFDLYARLRRAGADRYLLRHESASPRLYASLHPAGMTLAHRLACLDELRRLGFQVGSGVMVGAPDQRTEDLIADIRYLERFSPDMIGLGPFIPHRDTPFGHFPAGSAETTLRLYSILRLMHPDAMIPSTTALSALHPGGKLAGILAGANVIMPNFTPPIQREAYSLYNGKPTTDGAESLTDMIGELAAAGYTIDPGRGDCIKN
jgi:biotin synthase